MCVFLNDVGIELTNPVCPAGEKKAEAKDEKEIKGMSFIEFLILKLIFCSSGR
jgi:hypothetical protein